MLGQSSDDGGRVSYLLESQLELGKAIGADEVRAHYDCWFWLLQNKAPIEEQRRCFAPEATLFPTPGEPLPHFTVEANRELHEGFIEERHSAFRFTVIEMESVEGLARAEVIGRLRWQATRANGARIAARIGECSLLERSPDAGGLRFVLYWGNRFSYPPGSA
jgi:hypothetical protein